MQSVVLQIEMVSFGSCITCGVPIYGPSERYSFARRKPGEAFFCISGHSQHFTGKSEKELREEAEKKFAQERMARLRAERLREEDQKKLKRIKTRVANGVCPCCNRTFQNLHRHMNTKHPDYKKQEIG